MKANPLFCTIAAIALIGVIVPLQLRGMFLFTYDILDFVETNLLNTAICVGFVFLLLIIVAIRASQALGNSVSIQVTNVMLMATIGTLFAGGWSFGTWALGEAILLAFSLSLFNWERERADYLRQHLGRLH